MAKKTKAQENFESVRSSLFEKYPSSGDSGSGFVTSGNEDFDRLRKQMLEKYSTPQKKTVRSAPDYRRKSGTSLPSSQASRTKAMLDSSPDGGYGNYDATYSPARQGLSESSARYLRQQHYQQDKTDYDTAQKRYQEAQERASALKDERRLAEARARLGDGKYSDSYFTDLAKREKEAREAVGSAEDAMLPYKNRVDAYDATWGKVDKYADTVEKAKGTKGSYSGPSFEEMAAWEKQRSKDAMDQQMAAFRDTAYEDPESGPKVEDRLGFWLNLTDDQRQQETAVSGNAKHWGNLTEDEISAYYYLRQNQGQEAADQYLEDMENELSRREDAKFVEKVENAEGAELLGLNAASVAGNVLGGVPAAVDKAVGAVTGKQNPYSNGQMWQRYAGYVRGYTGQKVSDWAENGLEGAAGQEWAERAGNLANQTYQAVMSGVDSATGALVFGQGAGIPAGPFTMHVGGYTTVMGLGAAAQRAQELQLQGATDAQIALGSIGSGILEALFEDVSAEAFFENILENPATTAKEFAKKLATQMGVEASEEVCTEIGNLIWDSAVRGKNSDHQRAEREYMEQGMSRQDAKTQAALDSAMDIFWAGYGGAFSAGASSVVGQAFAGGQQAIEKARNNYQYGSYMAENGGDVLDLAEQAETLTDEKAGHKLSKQAEALAMELEGKEEPGIRDKYRMGKIAGDIAAQAQRESSEADVAAFREVAKNYLKDQENIKSPKRAEKLLVKAYTGEYMTRAEQVYFNSIGGKDLFAKVVDSTPYGGIQEATEAKQGKAWDTVMGLVDSAAGETTIRDVAAQYGKQAGAVERVYNMADTGSVTPENFGESFDAVYQKGAMGLPITEALKSTGVLTQNQAEMAYRIGTDAAGSYKSSDSGQAYITESREPVVVSSVESISEDGLTLKMDDGQTVNAKNVTFGSPEESMVYAAVGEVFQKAEDANRALTAWQNTGVSGTAFASALRDGYQKGRSGVDFARIRPKTEAGKLTQEIRKMAWEAGKASQDADTAKKETKLKSGTHKKAEAGLRVDQSVKDLKSYSRQQKTTLDLAKVLSKTGFSIEVFASTEEQRKSGVENGSFNTEDGSIRIDLNAGLNGEGLAAYALAHEVTHFAREFSPAKYQIFAETLIEAVNKSETSFEAMLDLKAAELSKLEAYQSLSETKLYDVAQDEVVAEMCETIFTDTDAAQRLSQRLYAKDQSLWGKFKSFVSDLVGRLKEAYAGLNPDSPIARRMKETVTQSENVLNAWVEAVAGAVENYNLQDGETVNAGTVIDRDGNSVEYLNSARVEDKETLDFLNDQETVTTYKTMQLVDGKLYPPMAAVVAGSYEDHSELGTWETATEHPELIKLDKSGKPKFTLNKGKGQGSLAAAYNPYMHSSNLVLNDQFSGAYTRPNLVTVECKVPTSELTSGYKAQYAKDSVGWHSWHTGTVAGALRQQTGTERQVFLSRWIMPVRIIPNSEVAQMYKQLLDGTDIAVPDNVVPPDLLKELKKAGVKISESCRVQNSEIRLSAREQATAKTLVDQLQEHRQELSQMKAVAEVDGTELNKDLRPVDAAMEFVKSFGGSVVREGFGEVRFSKTKVKSGLVGHGLGNAKMETFAAVPAVIRDGKQIGYAGNWKGQQKDSYVFAAPVSYKGETSYLGVIVEKDLQRNMYYVHEVVDQDGNVFAFDNKKEESTSDRLPSQKGGLDTVVDSSRNMIAQARADVNGENVRFSGRNQTTTKNFKRWFGDWENDQANASKVVNADGSPKVLYHQTAADFTIFDTRHPGAGTRDSDTPFGVFLKSSDRSIGLKGEKQMALYAKIVNPLTVSNREDLVRQLKKISPEYTQVSEELRALNDEYQRKYDDIDEKFNNYVAEWGKSHPGASRTAIYEDAGFIEISEVEDSIVDEWSTEAAKVEQRSKEAITRDLEANGYDGVIIQYDKGSWGRSTDAYIALHPEQVKSATDNTGAFDGNNPDIRYSSRTDSAASLQAELYQLENQRKKMVEADPAYLAAVEQRRAASTFAERVSASKALKAAESNIDTSSIDSTIAELRNRIAEAREKEIRQHREDQEKYSGTKTGGYSLEPDTRLKALDADYSEAVQTGNLRKMQSLVDQAAEAAMPKSVVRDESGKLLKVYHYTNGNFTVFDRGMARTGNEMDGFFFAPDKESTKEYGRRRIAAYLNITNLAVDPVLDRIFNDSGTLLREKLAAQGYDGVARTEEGKIYEYMVFDPNQVKYADPVTYDSEGNAVPLSQRFDFKNPDIRYSSRTQQDAEYMNLAKEPEKNQAALRQMVEQAAKDAGYTQLFYHGSKKGGGFTTFKDWQYFTGNRDYARRYAERGNDKSLYTTYVKMENPFDTRIDSVRDIFEDARMEYGMGELQENGLPDWTDGYDIADYIDENDLPYDSIVLDEGGDLVDGKPVSRGLSYVVRKSNQVKTADTVTYDDSGNVIPLSQRFNTDEQDIRYSRRGDSAQQQLDRQQAEIDRLKELLNIQKYGNKAFTLDRKSVEKAASSLLKSANAGGSKAELASLLDSFYRYLGTGEGLTWESVSQEAQKAVNFLMENRKKERDPYNQEVLDWMKGRHVALSQDQISEAEYLYGSMKEFRKALGGTVVLDQNANTSLDQFWQEAASKYGDKFSLDTTAGDMPGALAELVDGLRSGESLNTQEARYYEQEIRRDLTRQVYDSYWDVKPVQSVRDDMQKKLDLLKVEHRQAMEAAKAAARSEREKGQKALEDYRKQRDVVETTMMAAYAKQQAQVEQAYQQEMAELRKTYGKDTAVYQDEFFTAMKNKDFQNAHAPTLRKMLNELAKDNSGGNKDAEAARKRVYDNLRQQYELQKDIGALESKVQQQREAAKAKVESRRRTEMRKKIFDKAKTFQKMALSPGKANTAHGRAELMGALADFCSIFYESEAKAAESKWQGLDQREATAMKKNAKNQERELEIIRNQRERLAKRAEAVLKLQSAYRGLKESNALSLFHDDHVQSLVDNLSSLLSQSDIYGMSSAQLNEVYNVMKAMEYTITNANKVFSAGKDKTLIGMTNKLSKEIEAVDVRHGPVLNRIRKYWMWQMSPDTFFNSICGYAKGNEGKAIQQMFVTGMERMMGTQREFYRMFRPLTEATDKATAKAVRELMSKPLKDMVSWGLKNVDGQEVKTSKGMMLQAYMLLNQEDSFNSILYGGFKIPRMEEYYGGNRSDAYSNAETNQLLSAAIVESYMDLVQDIQEARQQGDQAQADALQTKAEAMTRGAAANLIAIRDQLSATIQADPTMSALVDTAAQWYKRSGELLAEVYEGMYGYKPNLVDGYTPIHRDLTNVKTDIREDSRAAFNLENIGLTKERVKSVDPIKLTDFFQELSDHTQQISRFYGFAQVQKDFDRIWNLKMPGSRSTVNALVADKYGAGNSLFGVSGEEYINNYIKSVAGSSDGGSVLERFYGSAASATLSLNPRVAFSQLASIPTAAAEVGWGSMARGFAKGFTVGLSDQKKSTLANDSIWFWQRYRGAGGSTEFSDLTYKGNLWSRVSGSKAGKALFNWCQSFDVFATSSMWAMAEDAVQHQQGLTPGAEGYQAAVEQKYADIIRKSQPNYTVTERSDLLRDKRAGMKLLTMYKTQSNQNLNILMNAWGEYKATMEGIKAGDGLYTQADKAAAGRKLANGITSVTIGGTLAFVLLRTAVNLVMGNLKYYRDDETDEMTGEGLVSGMVGEVLSSTAGMFALGGQLEEILYSAITGGRYYGISDSGISVIATAAEDGQKVLSTIFNREMENSQKRQYLKKYSTNLFYSAMTACGVPAKNAKTMLDAVGTWYTALTKGIPAAMEGGDTTATQYRARILRGWQEGDMGKIKDTLAVLAANSEEDTDEKVQKDVTSGVAQYLKKVFMKNQISGEEAQKLLAYIGHESPEETVQNWVFKKMYPDSDLSNAGIAKWNSYQDIPLDVFEAAYKYKGEHGKKAEIVAYIRGLNISTSMKKRLWEALKGNWTSKDTPW